MASSPHSLKEEGNAALSAGDTGLARHCWERALALVDSTPSDPTRIACLLNLAHVALRDALPDLAAEHCRAVLNVQPRNPKAIYRLSRAVAVKPALFGGGSSIALRQLRDELAAAPTPHDAAILVALKDLDAVSNAAAAAAGEPRCRGISAQNIPQSAGGTGCAFAHSADGHCENLLIMLHGLGDTGPAFMRFASGAALPQTCVLALTAPGVVPLVGGGMWYPSFDPETFERRVWGCASEEAACVAALRRAAAAVADVCTSRLPACGWPMSRIHLLGFGDGATVAAGACAMLLAAGTPVASLTAVCGALPRGWAADTGPCSSASAPARPFHTLLMWCAGDDGAPEAGVRHTAAVLDAAAAAGAGAASHSCSVQRLSFPAPPRMPSAAADVRPLMAHLAAALALRSIALESHPDIVPVVVPA